MKLEAGKTYRRRDGGLESIVEIRGLSAISGSGLEFGAENGLYWFDRPDDKDLISEVPSADQAFTQTAEAGLSVVRRKKEKRPTPQTDGQLAAIAHEPRDVAVRKLAAALRGMERQLAEAVEQREQYLSQLCIAMNWVYASPITNEKQQAMISRFEALELTPSASHE